jgi:hypothetical protein
MTTPVACSLRVAASPLKGAAPAAWQSQFRGTPGARHFAPEARVVSVCRLRCPFSGVLRVQAAGQRRRANTLAGRLL